MLPFANAPCPGVRPGGLVLTGAEQCTLSFLFRGADRHIYIATAGHCLLAEEGERLWRPGTGPRARTPDLFAAGIEDEFGIAPVGSAIAGARRGEFPIGEFAYARSGNGYEGRDFALIRLDQGVSYSAAVCHFGGPTGVYTYTDKAAPASVAAPLVFRMYGHGLGVSAGTPARTWIGQIPFRDEVAFAWGPGFLGDSGAPVVVDDGRAVGVMVAINVGGDWGPSALGSEVIVRLGPAVARAEKVMGIKLTLLTAPVA